MGIIATDAGGSDFEQVPTGTHNAICYKLVDAGTSLNEYQGEISKKHNVFIFWELPELRMADDRPMSINCQYTLSLNKLSKLRQHLQAWRNKSFTEEELNSFDLTKILGTTCKVDVGLTSGGNAKVQGVFCADGGAKKVATVNDQVVFDLEDYCDEFSGKSGKASKTACDIFEGLPRFMQWQIGGCEDPGKDKVEPCFELQAAMKKGVPEPEIEPQKKAKKTEPAGEEFVDDDIPF
jgi:hypothetical protein|tara:strand:- start:1610 stop:2317 length:708 start_codon:yes stop_codon:yes gene_type:complete